MARWIVFSFQLTRTDDRECLAALLGHRFLEALLQRGTARILHLPSNWQGLGALQLSRSWRSCCLWPRQMCQERSTLQSITDKVPQAQWPVLGLIEDGATSAAIVEFHHTRAPQALVSRHQLQSGRSWKGKSMAEFG